jgi:hypothetical protein
MLTTLRDLMTAPFPALGARLAPVRVAWAIARSFARSSSRSVAFGRSARRRSTTGTKSGGVAESGLRSLITGLYEPAPEFLTGSVANAG